MTNKELIKKYRKNAVLWVAIPSIIFAAIFNLLPTLNPMHNPLFTGMQDNMPIADPSQLSSEELQSLSEELMASDDFKYFQVISLIFGSLALISFAVIILAIVMVNQNLQKAKKIKLDSYDKRSGKGPSSEMPEEIKGWSWGASGLSFIWGTYHGLWITFLDLVPVLNLFWWIVLGVKGRAWAWENMRWESVDEFLRVQRKWDIWGGIIFFATTFIPFLMFVYYLFR